MRRKARPKKASPWGAWGNANSDIKPKENTSLKVLKQIGRPTKTPTGRGLGKAGAKRLGRLLKRAIQEESTGNGKVSLPKTPVRLFKHQVQTEAENELKTNTAKPASSHVSQLILSMVSQCKHQGGMSMAELKQTLAAAGYNVTKNSRQVNMVTKRVVINETLVRTTRNSSFRLNNKTDTQVMTSSVQSAKPKADHLKQSKTASKSTKGAQWSQRQAKKTPKPQGKLHKPKSKTRKTAAKSHKPRRKTPKARRKIPKAKRKTPKARRKTPKERRKTPKARRKMPKPAGKKRLSQRVQRSRQKQKQHPNKSSRKRQPPRQRLHKTRSRFKTQRRRVTRRRASYY